MATKPIVNVTSVASQASRRYLDTFYDQHKDTAAGFPNGRPFWGWREYAAMRGTADGFVGGDLIPGHHEDPSQLWSAPWLPEHMFFDIDYRKSAIIINYRRLLAHDKQGYDNYYEAANKIARVSGWPEIRYGSTPRYSVLAVLGDPPRSPKIAQACMAGDRWLLGFSKEVNVELAQLLGLSGHGFRVEREPVQAALPAEGVLQLTADELRALIREEAEKIAARDARPKRRHRRTKPVVASIEPTADEAQVA